jgi:hypothetical protein
MPKFDLVGESYVAAAPAMDNQEAINWFVEPSITEGARTANALLGAPGCIAAVTSSYAGEVRGCWAFSNNTQALWIIGGSAVLMTIAAPATASAPAAFALSTVGTLSSTTGKVCMRDNGLGKIVACVDGSNLYAYNIGSKVFKTIVDPAFLGATNIAFIDGWFIFNQPSSQGFFVSPNYWDGTKAFDATYIAFKDDFSDSLISLIENHRQLWLVGSQTTEVWYNAGGQYFPFSRLEGAMIQVGCAAAQSLCRFSDGLLWLARSERGENLVVMAKGYQVEPVSTPAVSYAIAQYPVVDDAFGYVYTEEGHSFYVLTFPTADVTWVYDLNTQKWHKRARYDASTGTFRRHRGNCYLSFAGQRLIGDYNSGQIYRLSRQVYVDGPDPLVSMRRTPHVWDGGDRNRVRQSRLEIELRKGPGIVTGQGSDPAILVRWSNNGGMTWGNWHTVAIGKIGEYNRRSIIRRLGAGRDRVYEFRVSDPVNRDLVGATLRGDTTTA